MSGRDQRKTKWSYNMVVKSNDEENNADDGWQIDR